MRTRPQPDDDEELIERAAIDNPIYAADAYFSADVETDGPIPGPYSMLSLGLVFAGSFDGEQFQRSSFRDTHYVELKPISKDFDLEAMIVNGLDRERLSREGADPTAAMTEAAKWVKRIAGSRRPILVAYPKSFDWLWLYWYFVNFSETGSPFSHSGCYDIKTAFAVKSRVPFSMASRKRLLRTIQITREHTHHALADAIEQAEIFGALFDWTRDRKP